MVGKKEMVEEKRCDLKEETVSGWVAKIKLVR